MRTDQRRFGVEIECDTGGRGTDWMRELLSDNGLPHWTNVGYDGSEIEIRTPILQGRQGFAELEKVFGLLNQNRCRVTQYDGMHVHHDAPEFHENGTPNAFALQAVRSWMNNQEAIDKFVDPYRHNNGACSKWTEDRYMNVENRILRDGQSDNEWFSYGGRGALNISALGEHGTIEFRQHEGTLDFAQAEAWIRFGQAFLNAILNRKSPITRCDPEVLLKRVKTNKRAAEKLARRAKGDSYVIAA